MKARPSRRMFLGSAAAVVGLPFLESLLPRQAHAQACGSPQRYIACFVPNGIHMPDWTPTTTGTDWEMPYILQPLEPIRNKLLVLTGLDHHQTAEPSSPPGGHASGTGSFLTMLPATRASDNNPNRTSVDQYIAQSMADCQLPIPSLQLALKVDNDGGSDGASTTAYNTRISWVDNTPQANIESAATAFNRLFEGFDPDSTATAELDRSVLRSSVLDYIEEEAQTIHGRLGATDRIKIEQYLNSVRSLETRIQNLGNGDAVCSSLPEAPAWRDDAPYSQRVPLMLDVAALAFECDATRVISFMMGRGTSLERWDFLPDVPISDGHHNISHHGNGAASLSALREIARWEMEQWASFLIRLDGIQEADGSTLLDNSATYFSSEISDGNSHKKYDMPVLLAGSAGGRLNTDGSHVSFTQMNFPRPTLGPSGGPHTGKVHVAMMNALGVDLQTFGDESFSGPLEGLLA